MGQVQNDMGWVGVNTAIVANQNTHNISLQQKGFYLIRENEGR